VGILLQERFRPSRNEWACLCDIDDLYGHVTRLMSLTTDGKKHSLRYYFAETFYHQTFNRDFLRKCMLHWGIFVLNSQIKKYITSCAKNIFPYLKRQLARHIINQYRVTLYVCAGYHDAVPYMETYLLSLFIERIHVADNALGPGTALCFGLSIVARLAGTEKAQQIKQARLLEKVCD